MSKFLLLSTSVGPLGSGLGGGVELTVKNIAQELTRRGHILEIIAPSGSTLPNIHIQEIPGNLQVLAQTLTREDPITLPHNSVLANIWEYARKHEHEYDLLVNFAYDWLPFYLTPFFKRPIAHLVSMASLTEAMDSIIKQTSKDFPHSVAFHTQSQADTFALSSPAPYLGNAIELKDYYFYPHSSLDLAWVGRIAPEKALEDALEAARETNLRLRIFGAISDHAYWQSICQSYPEAIGYYEGFLSTKDLQKELGQCQALLVTPRWVEAFGNVVIEALACGVPVITYKRGGPGEIVKDGQTGFLVEPDQVSGIVEAIQHLSKISRLHCRQQVEQEYSLAALGDRLEAWFKSIEHYNPNSST